MHRENNLDQLGPVEAKSRILYDVGLRMRTGHIARTFYTNPQESSRIMPSTILSASEVGGKQFPDRTYVGDFGGSVFLGIFSAFLYSKGVEQNTQGFYSLGSYSMSLTLGLASLVGIKNGIQTIIRLKRQAG